MHPSSDASVEDGDLFMAHRLLRSGDVKGMDQSLWTRPRCSGPPVWQEQSEANAATHIEREGGSGRAEYPDRIVEDDVIRLPDPSLPARFRERFGGGHHMSQSEWVRRGACWSRDRR